MTYQSKVMTVYILGLFMTIIDGTMVNVALPRMAEDFGVGTTDIEWIAVGYLLTYAAVIPAAGWLGDRFAIVGGDQRGADVWCSEEGLEWTRSRPSEAIARGALKAFGHHLHAKDEEA